MDVDKLIVINLGALCLFILKEIFNWAKDAETKLKDAMIQNTLAVHRLTVKLEFIEKRLESVPEIRKDLDGLGEKVRSLVKSNGA